MKVTNKHNLPEAFVNAVTWNSRTPNPKRFSVTDLISPPQIRQLKIKHWEQLTDDVSDRLWALLGNSVHYVLEKGSPKESLSEEKLAFEIDGNLIVGIPDIYHNKQIHDYKVTSVYSFILGDKAEWEQQLNVNGWLFNKAGFIVEALKIYAILRDWKKSDALRDYKYPQIPFQAVDIPLWSVDAMELFIRARIEAHNADKVLCSDKERWMRPKTYAVKAEDKKKALRVFNTMEEAKKALPTLKGKNLTIEERKGAYIRCESYCPVSEFCPQVFYEGSVEK